MLCAAPGWPPAHRASITLPSGLEIQFLTCSKTSIPEDSVVLSLARQRELNDPVRLATEIQLLAGSGKRVVLQNDVGSWITPAAAAARIGIPGITAWQDSDTSLSSTDIRRYLAAPEAKICCLPNYKCGYSSLWAFFASEFQSFKVKESAFVKSFRFRGGAPRNGLVRLLFRKKFLSTMVNGQCSIAEFDAYYKFSVVRHPAARFESFFRDKFCRTEQHHNYRDWFLVYGDLLGKRDFKPVDILKLVALVPSAFADPHFRSAYDNLHHDGNLLVDEVFDLKSLPKLSERLSQLAGRKLEIPRETATSGRGLASASQLFDGAQELIDQVYSQDLKFYQRTLASGGILAAE